MTTATAGQTAARGLLEAPGPRPVWERQQLFLEPVYVDGGPYDQDEEEELQGVVIVP